MVGMSGGTAHQINYWRPTTGVSCVAVQSALRLTVLATFRSKAMATIPAAQREYQTCTSVPWRFARHRSIHWKEPEKSWGTFRGNLFKRGWLSLEESTTSGTDSVAAGSTSTKGSETSLGPFFLGHARTVTVNGFTSTLARHQNSDFRAMSAAAPYRWLPMEPTKPARPFLS
jgi:hypothetical protein